MSGYFNLGKNLYKGFQKVFDASRSSSTPKNLRGTMSTTIVGVKPNVPTTKLEKAKSKLAIAKQKAKTSALKLKNTLADIKEKAKTKNPLSKYKEKIKKIVDKKANGGRIGRRFGGDTMPKRKTNVQKIRETFAPKKKNLSPKQMKIAKLAGNPNKIDGADFKKLRGKA